MSTTDESGGGCFSQVFPRGEIDEMRERWNHRMNPLAEPLRKLLEASEIQLGADYISCTCDDCRAVRDAIDAARKALENDGFGEEIQA